MDDGQGGRGGWMKEKRGQVRWIKVKGVEVGG